MNYQKTKPVFSNITDIKPGMHCYNVYCKVVKVDHSVVIRQSGDRLQICEGLVADHTGCANFKFEGENCDYVKEGAVIAIRNGRSDVIQEHIRLEVDKFGRVTVEDAGNVGKVSTADNISDHAYVRREADQRTPREERRHGNKY